MAKCISVFFVVFVVFAAYVAIMAGMSTPAMARTSETVELTFRLEVEGDVPGWQHFAVEYYPAGGQPGTLSLCTTAAGGGAAAPRCEGGHTYTATAEVPAGSAVTYRFLRHDTRAAPEYFKAASEAFDVDSSVSASYIFPSGAPGEIFPDDGAAREQYDDEGAVPNTPDDLFPETNVEAASGAESSQIAALPDTGGAGAALALGLALVMLGGFAFRRTL